MVREVGGSHAIYASEPQAVADTIKEGDAGSSKAEAQTLFAGQVLAECPHYVSESAKFLTQEVRASLRSECLPFTVLSNEGAAIKPLQKGLK